MSTFIIMYLLKVHLYFIYVKYNIYNKKYMTLDRVE